MNIVKLLYFRDYSTLLWYTIACGVFGTLHIGLTYDQRHSVNMMTCPSVSHNSAVNGDTSRHDSGNTTPLAFDYDTRSPHILFVFLCYYIQFKFLVYIIACYFSLEIGS